MRTSIGLLLLLVAAPAHAQTVQTVAGRGACSTAGVEGISRQLAEEQMCLRPGGFVRFTPHPNISLSSSRVHPYAQASAANAIRAAADSRSLSINSAFRTLADQYVLYHSGGCGLAARPGRSNHQSGRAIDVGNHSAARSALTGNGCAWFGSSDAVHFDCPGSDMRADSIRAFQRLWNRNNPSDTIAEDGVYGPQTETRLGRAPAGGFAISGCEPGSTCTPACEGDGFVDAACNRTSCPSGQVCDASGAPACVTPSAPGGGAAVGAIYVDQGDGGVDTSVRVPRAEVRLLETGEATLADATGVYHFDVEAGTYTVEASADGYVTASRECVVEASGDATWCPIGLASTSMGTGTLRGVVYDADRGITERVIGATVTVSGQSAAVHRQDGSFQFEVAPGEHTVEASGPGIVPASATCLVVADDTTWCSVGVRGADGVDLETVTVDEPIPDNGGGMPTEMMPPGPEGPIPGDGRGSVGGCATAPTGQPAPFALLAVVALGFVLRRRRR